MKHVTKALSGKAGLWALTIILISAVITVLIFDTVGEDRIRGLIEQGGPLAPLLYICFKALTYIIAPLGSGPIVMLSGTVFGPWWGTLYSMLGDLIGGSVNYWIAHLFGRALVLRFTGKQGLTQVDHYYEVAGEWKGLLFARFALSGFYDFISYAAGLTKLPFHHYVLVSLIGGVLPTAYAVFFGATLLSHRWLFFSILGVAALLLVILWWMEHRQPSSQKASKDSR